MGCCLSRIVAMAISLVLAAFAFALILELAIGWRFAGFSPHGILDTAFAIGRDLANSLLDMVSASFSGNGLNKVNHRPRPTP